MTTYVHARAIRAFRLRVAAALFLRTFLAWCVAWLFAWGAAVLVLRALAGVSGAPLVWGLAAPAALAPIALVLARRRVPGAQTVRALLDRAGSCGGLLMAEAEADLGAWRERLPDARAPRVRWRGRRTLVLLAAAGAFAALSFLVPQKYVDPTQHPLNVERETGSLAEQIEALREEQILEPQVAAELEKKLEQIAAAASGEDPAKTWEALDHLKDSVKNAARQPAENAVNETERLAQAESLAKNLAGDADQMKPADAAEAMKKLGEMVNEAARKDPASCSKIPEELLGACKEGTLTAEQCKALAEALGECKEGIAGKLGRLSEAGLIDAELVALNEELGQCKGDGLAAFLKEGEGKGAGMSAAELLDAWMSGDPGRGGVNRGRGDAPMVWTDPSTKEGVEFKAEALPPASVAALKDSRVVGTSTTAPEVEKGKAPSAGGAIGGAAAGGGSAHTQTLLPRHQAAVKRYFERKEP